MLLQYLISRYSLDLENVITGKHWYNDDDNTDFFCFCLFSLFASLFKHTLKN